VCVRVRVRVRVQCTHARGGWQCIPLDNFMTGRPDHTCLKTGFRALISASVDVAEAIISDLLGTLLARLQIGGRVNVIYITLTFLADLAEKRIFLMGRT